MKILDSVQKDIEADTSCFAAHVSNDELAEKRQKKVCVFPNF